MCGRLPRAHFLSARNVFCGDCGTRVDLVDGYRHHWVLAVTLGQVSISAAESCGNVCGTTPRTSCHSP